MKRTAPFWLLPLALAATPPLVFAYDWGSSGVPVCVTCAADAQMILPDGSGGAFIAFRWSRPSTTGDDVYLQRITSSGQIAPGWPVDGVPVCTAPKDQVISAIASDGQGGVLIVWQDFRNQDSTSSDIYAQRVRMDGTLAPGWPVDGAPVSRTLDYQSFPAIDADGSGGAYVAWGDWTRYGYTTTVYVQHLDAAGQPFDGWPPNGMEITTVPSEALNIVPDPAGGAVVTWGQARGDSADVYATKVTPSGEIAAGWPAGGAPIALGCGGRSALPDGAGGFYVVCAIVQAPFEREYEVHRWIFSGSPVPGWPEAGLRCGAAPGDRALAPAKRDALGGVLLGWWDYRNPQGGSDVYATRIRPDATFAPGWPQDGALASDPAEPLETDVDIAPDGSGGAYLVWQWDTNTGSPSKIQHLTSDGHVAPGWPAVGVRVDPSSSQFHARVVEDGRGGAIVVWNLDQLFAQHFSPELPVPALPALASADATSERVVLVWTGTGDVSAIVYRRLEATEWTAVGHPLTDGASQLRFEDRDVVAGQRYAYRLGVQGAAGEQFTASTWVDVPSDLHLALEGFRPNPSRGSLVTAFTLPNSKDARLEVYDAAGRMVASRDVGSMGPGRHLLDLSSEASLASGVYWLRLSQSAQSLLTKGIVLR